MCCVPEPPLCVIKRRRENITEGFDVHVLRLDEIEKWRICIDSKQKPNEEIELKVPSDRDRVLFKNLMSRKEQVARLNLSVPPIIQKCFNRLHRNLSAKVEWRDTAIVVNDNILIDEKSNYRHSRIDPTLKSDPQSMKSLATSVSYINKILDSFWKEELESNPVILSDPSMINQNHHPAPPSSHSTNETTLFHVNSNDPLNNNGDSRNGTLPHHESRYNSISQKDTSKTIGYPPDNHLVESSSTHAIPNYSHSFNNDNHDNANGRIHSNSNDRPNKKFSKRHRGGSVNNTGTNSMTYQLKPKIDVTNPTQEKSTGNST